jgi:sigma-B regulation protein RsbU (phosphoserine phosphatase)
MLRKILIAPLIRRSVRYLLLARGLRLVEVVVVLTALSIVLTGPRIAAIDRWGNRADIVVSILVTIAAVGLLRSFNRRMMTAIDRRFFREAYDAQMILTHLGEAIPARTKLDQVIQLVADQVNAALHPEQTTVFLEDEAAGAYVAAYSFQRSSTQGLNAVLPPAVPLPFDQGIVKAMREFGRPNTVSLDEVELLPSGTGVAGVMPSSAERRAFRETGSRLLIPISANGRLYGIIALGQRLSGLPYADDDQRLLLVVANQIAAFIANMKILSHMAEEERAARELELAAEVQRHLFPAGELDQGGLEIYGLCLPARGVGGDYYDYFALDERRTGIAVADVAGKGIAAALLMSTVQASLRCQLNPEVGSLTDIVGSMNRFLRRSTSDGGYATFFFAEYDQVTHGLTYVNAGHNPPLLVRANSSTAAAPIQLAAAGATTQLARYGHDGATESAALFKAQAQPVEWLTTGGPIIGTFLNGPYEQATIEMRSGDVLVVYTDGVTEAMNAEGAEFGEDRLNSAVSRFQLLPVREVANELVDRVLEWQGTEPQHDDITLIVAKAK